jgi:tRNA1Val (adenine37-N6)-methyltransferase
VANNFFQFKQFTVQQQFCAMKVSTDSCIFGAAVAEAFAETELQADNTIANYLDIGTGTGLLSLMLAQKTSAVIDAVEIDNTAYEQAGNNFSVSPFKEKLSIYNNDVLHFNPGKKYDGIICNPPFFEGDLKTGNQQLNAAKHSTTFTLQQLIQIADAHLKDSGILVVLLPFHRVDDFITDAIGLNFYVQQKILLRHTVQHPYFRGILFFSKTNTSSVTKELIIKNEAGNYTDDFIHLLKDYYLYL